MSFTLPYIENSSKRVRVLFGGEYIIDTKKAKLVWERPYYSAYFFSEEDLPPSRFLKGEKVDDSKKVYDIVVGPKHASSALTSFTSKELEGLFTITFDTMDAWFEEEEQIFVHCKDPYKRVDVLQSSRHVRVEVDGVELANTRMPRLLFETGLHVRTYIPKNDCRLDLLESSDLTTQCPYKGEAQYYHVVTQSGKKFENIVWWYRNPTPECAAIRGYIAFYDEKVNVWVDGEKQK